MNRVLLIDDNVYSREALQRQLSGLGFSVMASDSSDALHALEAEPDYVLLKPSDSRPPEFPPYSRTQAYILHDSKPPESLTENVGLRQSSDALFWHRRLLRALNGSVMLPPRTI